MKACVVWAFVILGAATLSLGTGALLVALCRWARSLGARLVSEREARDKHCPGLPCDGRPLSVPERERLEQIGRGFWRTAAEPGRQR